MPVIQDKSNDFGDILGGILGTAGAFISGQKQKKDQDAERARQAALDAQTVAETLYRHAEDQKRDVREQTTFDEGQQDRNAAIATASGLQQFRSGLKYPPNWNKMSPDQKVSYLQQRANAAQQKNDPDTFKQTMDQIKEIQGSADKQAALQERVKEAQENRDAAMQRALVSTNASSARQALTEASQWERTLEVMGGEDERQQNQFEQQMRMLGLRWQHEDTVNAKKPAPKNTQYTAEDSGLNQSPDFKALPPGVQAIIRGAVSQHGMKNTMQSLSKIAQGAPNTLGVTKQQAQDALDALAGQ